MVTDKYEDMEPKPNSETDSPTEIMTTRECSAKAGLTSANQLVMFPPGRNSFRRPVSKDTDDTDE